MIEIVPIMLFILGWHPDKPGEIDLQRPEIIFKSIEECEVAGAKMAARMTQVASEQSGARYEHRCFKLPSDQEFRELYESNGRAVQ